MFRVDSGEANILNPLVVKHNLQSFTGIWLEVSQINQNIHCETSLLELFYLLVQINRNTHIHINSSLIITELVRWSSCGFSLLN